MLCLWHWALSILQNHTASSLCPPTGGGSYSHGRGEELTRWQGFQARAGCATLNKSSSHSASEIVMLIIKLSRLVVLFWLGNTLVYEVLRTGLEEHLPSRIGKGQRERQGEMGRNEGGWKIERPFVEMCPAINCCAQRCLRNVYLNSIGEECVVCPTCLCMSLAREMPWPCSQFPRSMDHRKNANTLTVFCSL